MRALFFLLLLANAVFYVYAFVARERNANELAVPELQINADKIRILRRGESGAGSAAPAAAATDAPAACLAWGVITGPDIARADAALARLNLNADAFRRVMANVTGYWVHIPSLKSTADANQKLNEAKAFGIADVSIVQDPALGRLALSLGLFSTEEAAQIRLALLQSQGLRAVVMEPRPGAVKQVRFFMRAPSEEIVGRLAEVQREFPGTKIEVGPCPAALQGVEEREEAPRSERSTHAFDQRAGRALVFERD